jgi:hypothetical protein
MENNFRREFSRPVKKSVEKQEKMEFSAKTMPETHTIVK